MKRLRSCMELDFGKVPTYEPPYEVPTYEQVQVQTDKGVMTEVRKAVIEPIPFDYRDFSLKSIIESGNVNLLNPVGMIAENNMVAADKVGAHAEYLNKIDDFNNVVNTEE